MTRVTTSGLQSSIDPATAIAEAQWAAGAGSADVITAAYDPVITDLVDGLILGVRLSATNATTTPSYEPDGLGAHTIKKLFGVALEPGDLPDEALLRYKLSDTSWTLLNPQGHFRVATAEWAIAGGTVDVITASLTPPTGTLVDGQEVCFRATGANVSATPTFSPDTKTARIIKKLGGQALAPGDIYGADHEVRLRYHSSGTPWWELVNPAGSSASAYYTKALTADAATFADDTNVHAIPGLGVTLAAGFYRFTGKLHTTRALGTTSHVTKFLFGGTAAITSIRFVVRSRNGDAQALAAVSDVRFESAAAQVVKAASTSATEDVDLEIDGHVIVGTAGTLLPSLQYDVAPGGVTTPKQGSIFDYVPRTNGQGTWA